MTAIAIVFKEVEFDMGHRVPNHKSKCRNLHGHRYKVRVGVRGPIITNEGDSSEGMVVDFGDLKQVMMEQIHDLYDHKTILYRHDAKLKQIIDPPGFGIITVSWIPTAENLALHFFYVMDRAGFEVEEVQVYETPTSVAVYRGGFE